MSQEPIDAIEAHPKPGPMAAHTDPASVLRCAWSQIRLRRIQQVVIDTITLLNEAEPGEVLGLTSRKQQVGQAEDPIAEALEACCAELREECGMQDSLASRADHGELVRRCMAEHAEWAAVFREALPKYRELAARLLQEALRDPVGATISL